MPIFVTPYILPSHTGFKTSLPAGGGGVLAFAFRFSFEQAPQVPTFNQEAFRAFFKDVI